MISRLGISSLTFLMLILLSLSLMTDELMSVNTSEYKINELDRLKNLINALDDDAYFLKTTKCISEFGSRMTGYPGCKLVENYIYNKFKELGIKTSIHKYKVLVPLEKKCVMYLTLNNGTVLTFKIASLYPNLIQTCNTAPEGIKGKLVYVANIDKANGKEIGSRIVLTEFNTGSDWIHFMRLGAKAVIFIEPLTTSKAECMQKFLQSPIHFPRLFIDRSNGLRIKSLLRNQGETAVKIISRVNWEWVTAKNIIGIINGTELPNEVILVTTHYDAWSIVPSRAFSADEALNIAVLIKLAEYFSKNPPKRSIWFIALSGHWQGLAGIREFINDYFFSEEVQSGKIKIWTLINLDLSSGSRRISLVYTSYFYRYLPPILSWEGWFKTKVTTYMENLDKVEGKELSSLVDWGVQRQGWWAKIPEPYIIDSEPAVISGPIAFTLRTSEDKRMHWGIPISDLGHINVRNIITQAKIAGCLIDGFANDEDLGLSWDSICPSRLRTGTGVGPGSVQGNGFVTLRGVALEYNVSKGWFQPVPNALVVIKPTVNGHLITYPFSTIITQTNEKGEFEVHGLMPSVISEEHTVYTISAWKLDDETGHIIYAMDMGIYGREINRPIQVMSAEVNCSIAIFQCRSIVLLDVYSPLTLSLPEILDTRSALETITAQPVNIMLYNIKTGAECFQYGTYYLAYEPVALAFARPYDRVMIKITYGVPARATVFIVNASDQYPEGYGYVMKDISPICISVINRSAEDMYMVSNTRYSKASGFLLRHISLEKYLNYASEHLKRAKELVGQKVYDTAYKEYIIAWLFAIKSYEYVQKLISESAITTLILGVLITISSLLLERLVFAAEGAKRLITTLILVVGMFSLFFYIFPGYRLIFSPSMLMLAIPLAYMLIIVIFLFFSKAFEEMKRRRIELFGEHEIERKYSSFLLHGFTISLRYMRRRRLRSTLMMISIAVTTFAMVGLASISSHVIVRQIPLGNVNSFYEGYLVKLYTFGQSFEPLGIYELSIVDQLFKGKAVVNPRVWVYPQVQLPQAELVSDVYHGDKSVKISAMLGLSYKEMKTIFKNAILEGRLPLEGETSVCLVPKTLKQSLGLKVGDMITWCGIDFRVVGVYDEMAVEGPMDPDGYPLLPYDPLTVSQISRITTEEAQQYGILPLSSIIIIPYRTALDLGGYIMSISIYTSNNNFSDELMEILALLDLKTYMNFDNTSYSISITTAYLLLGFEQVLVLTIIASLNILMSMLGTIKERYREIYTHSVLGLNPRDAALLFLIETITYAIIGISVGYLAGIYVNYFLLRYGLLPSSFIFNYSSSAITIVISIVLLAAVITVIYPIKLASKIVTPSFERRWKLSIKPTQDYLEVKMPFILPREEVLALFKYLYEYYSSVSEEELRSFRFIESIKIDTSEPPRFYSKVALAPYEANITQAIWLSAQPIEKNKYVLTLYIKKLSGLRAKSAWLSSNYHLINSIRKQILLWRGLSEDKKRRYYKDI